MSAKAKSFLKCSGFLVCLLINVIPVPEVEVPGNVQDQQDGAFFSLTNLWSKNYNRRKEGILTNFDILMSVFQAGDRIFLK